MITPEQMLQEAIDRINALSMDELEALFRNAGLDPVEREVENCALLSQYATECIKPDVGAVNGKFALLNNKFLDIAA